MDAQLDTLESKIAQAVTLIGQLRAENQQLRAELIASQGEKSRLTERMELARNRLEALLEQIPQEDD